MSVEHILLLFDVDGVLIHPVGYKLAFHRTIEHFARLMGQPSPELTEAELAIFEASGIPNEWDTTPMCVGAMLINAIKAQPGLVSGNFMVTLQAIKDSRQVIERPDFSSLAREAHRLVLDHVDTTEAIRRVLQKHAPEELRPLIANLLRDIYSMETPTTHVFQNHTLGNLRYEKTYGSPAGFEAHSTLEEDLPLLDLHFREILRDKALKSMPGFSIFTARPSSPQLNGGLPAGNYPPEAEIGLELLGLNEAAPLIAGGQVTWLAAHRGKSPGDYIKPSPVQALAAIGAAASGDVHSALLAAADLNEEGTLNGPLARLVDNQPVKVVVFEDTLGGIRAVRKAVDILNKADVNILAEAVGVSPDPSKRHSLQQHADRVVSDINEGVIGYL